VMLLFSFLPPRPSNFEVHDAGTSICDDVGTYLCRLWTRGGEH
jgi:hypothetical protein